MSQGWIKLHRQIDELDFWTEDRFNRGQAWVDLLLLANHKDRIIFIRGHEIQVKRGELAWSIVSLSKKWHWNERTVNKFLKALETRQMIQSRVSNITTIITILKYDLYQGDTEQSTERDTEHLLSRVQTDKNDKKEKNDNNEKKGEATTQLFKNFSEYVSGRGIDICISESSYLLMRSEFDSKLSWFPEVRACVDWLFDNKLKQLSAPRLRKWMNNSLKFAKEKELKNMTKLQDQKNQLVQKMVIKPEPLWTPPN